MLENGLIKDKRCGQNTKAPLMKHGCYYLCFQTQNNLSLFLFSCDENKVILVLTVYCISAYFSTVLQIIT